MLLLGHTGITLGSAIAVDAVLNWNQFRKEPLSPIFPINKNMEARLKSLAQRIDIRILLIGSLLPDIIDKPLGYLIIPETLANGRAFCHTFLFLFLAIVIGLYVQRKTKRNWLLVVSIGIFTHLVFDQMWLAPYTLLWPLYGLSFPPGDSNSLLFIKGMLTELLSSPSVYVSEIVGTIVLLIFTNQLIRLKSLNSFIRKGCV